MNALTNVGDYESINDCCYNDVSNNNVNMNVQSDNDNLLCNDHNYIYDAGNFQPLFHQSHKAADEFPNIRGESSRPQVTTQHNRGGGTMFKQDFNSKCFTAPVANHQCSNHIRTLDMATLQYTNWCRFFPETHNYVHIVYLTTDGQLTRGFFYIVSDTIFGPGQLYCCENFPGECLEIIYTQNMLIHCPLKIQKITKLEKVNADITADNFKQDHRTFKCLNMSYEKYMDRIIMNLIEKQSKFTHNVTSKVRPRDNSVVSDIVDGIDMKLTNDTDPLPKFFENFIEPSSGNPRDFNDPDKDRGFISLEETEFKFIGPDRDFCPYDSIDQVTRIGNIIKATGLPNYKQARFPVRSNLNLPAWEKHLADYPDQRVYQYLKFGFPLSLTDPDSIHNINISNHFSALQYPEAIQQYLDKEKAHGAILGPFSDIPSVNFHCSPMLTRPKDTDKRRVILNLSYPKGQSLNDNVDKQLFDGKRFTLKFPTIDDICNEIGKNPNEILMSKIDISRAFRNLRIDPGDALKFGLSWRGQYYQDLSAAFGWIHGSASFQLVADVITHIMKRKGFKTFAYIDDFILINPKSKAQQAFDTLTDLLQELGLPMNNDKRTPPTRTLTCLGICLDLNTNTLSIDAGKIEAIYDQCLKTLGKNTISKKQLQSLLGKLLYLHKCVKPARIFVNRILATFRQNCHKNKIQISTEIKQDIQWFIRFLPQFNGSAILVKTPIQQPHTLHIDASLTGLGGVWGNRVYTTPIYPISTFEMG